MPSPTLLITGAKRGIGLEIARAAAARGDSVIAAVRGTSPELDALGVRIEELDVGDDSSIQALARRLAGVEIDQLVHNAAIAARDTLEDVDSQAMADHMRVNAIGPLMLTQALLPNLSEGSKVALITSRMGSIADNGSGAGYAYRMSKAAMNMLGKSLSVDLAPRKIPVVTLHPGIVDTTMLAQLTGGAPRSATGAQGPEEVGPALLAHVDAVEMTTTGRFLHVRDGELPW